MIIIRIGQLADQLGVHRNTIRNWISTGRLPARSMAGKRYLVSEDDFNEICREFGIDRSSLRLKYVPGAPLMSREEDLHEKRAPASGSVRQAFGEAFLGWGLHDLWELCERMSYIGR